ncbi:glycosyltransferase [Wohlfahrtiimonas chitiniclastica]
MGIHRIDEYVDDAINSILNQSFRDFEFIIVANGAASNEIENYIFSYFNDPRIRIIKSSIGQLAYALNLAIDASQYDYIARMDADDIAHKDRLEKQLAYLQKHNLDLVGSSVNLINENDIEIGQRVALSGKNINKALPFKCPFIHPTVFYIKERIVNVRGYNSGFNSEDYDLWLRLNRQGITWDNIQEPLLDYRIHTQASQRQLLGYAECTGYAIREFILQKSFRNFCAIFVQLLKSFIRPDRSEKD